MAAPLTALRILTALGTAPGAGLAFGPPHPPPPPSCLLPARGLGIPIPPMSPPRGPKERTRWLMAVNAAIVAVALPTTQIAARRAISSTHLEYRGVHVA